jgi:hypothetical protein
LIFARQSSRQVSLKKDFSADEDEDLAEDEDEAADFSEDEDAIAFSDDELRAPFSDDELLVDFLEDEDFTEDDEFKTSEGEGCCSASCSYSWYSYLTTEA